MTFDPRGFNFTLDIFRKISSAYNPNEIGIDLSSDNVKKFSHVFYFVPPVIHVNDPAAM